MAILDFDNFGDTYFFLEYFILFATLKIICIEVNFVYLW